MNSGLISPSETNHHPTAGGRIRPNGAEKNVMGLRVVY